MLSTMRAGKGTEMLAGWAMETADGARTFFANPSESMRAHIAARYDAAWIRGYVIEGGQKVVLA